MAFAKNSPLGQLLAGPMRAGQLAWIGLRPARRATVIETASATLIAASGIEGDRYQTKRNGSRQVTLVGLEDLNAVAAFIGVVSIAPALLRRNLVTGGINLLALKDRRFRIGSAVLEWSGDCAPCSRMEEALGLGGYNAVRGHGGITARIIEGGNIQIGDSVVRID